MTARAGRGPGCESATQPTRRSASRWLFGQKRNDWPRLIPRSGAAPLVVCATIDVAQGIKRTGAGRVPGLVAAASSSAKATVWSVLLEPTTATGGVVELAS